MAFFWNPCDTYLISNSQFSNLSSVVQSLLGRFDHIAASLHQAGLQDVGRRGATDVGGTSSTPGLVVGATAVGQDNFFAGDGLLAQGRAPPDKPQPLSMPNAPILVPCTLTSEIPSAELTLAPFIAKAKALPDGGAPTRAKATA